jgi:hypothetical protein
VFGYSLLPKFDATGDGCTDHCRQEKKAAGGYREEAAGDQRKK